MLKTLQRCFNESHTVMAAGQRAAMTRTSVRCFGGAASGFDASLAGEMGKFKVAPAAGWWMRAYAVLPSQLVASGPKGYILKGDVLKYIKANNLSMRPQESPSPSTATKSEPKAAAPKAAKPAPAKKQKAAAASPVFNPDDPFQQIWADQEVGGDLRGMADSLHYSKRMLAHSYMSSQVDMTQIAEKFADAPLDAFVIRAAAKAFRKAIGDEPLNVSRVFSHDRTIAYTGVQDLRIGQLASAGVENGELPAGQATIRVYQVSDSVESLPISEDSVTLSVHFTPPTRQVTFDSIISDISSDSFGDEEGAGQVATISAD